MILSIFDCIQRPRGAPAMDEHQHESEGMQRQVAYTIQTLEIQCSGLGKGSIPEPRGGATLTQVESGDIYLIGGANRQTQSFGDIYHFDLATMHWNRIKPIGKAFPPRSGHSATAIDHRIVVFGGMNPTECALYEDVMILDTATQQWTTPLIEGWMPGARNAHAAIQLPACEGHERILVYGGSSPEAGAFGDVFILHLPIEDLEAPLRWERVDCVGSEIPEARELHTATLLTETTVLFSGGRNRDGNVCTDMAVLDVAAWEWQLVPICEWNRCSHVAATVDGEVVSFGGFDGSSIRDDCWVYADNEESWLRVKKSFSTEKPEVNEAESSIVIPGRFGHCGCTVRLPVTSGANEKQVEGLLVFGGMNAEHDLNDLVLITPSRE